MNILFYHIKNHSFTDEGIIYKLVEWYNRDGEEHSNLVDIFEATTPEPIRSMEISSKVFFVYLAH